MSALHAAADNFLLDRLQQQTAAPHELAKKLKRIAESAERLRERLADSGDVHYLLVSQVNVATGTDRVARSRRQKARFDAAVAAVTDIREWCRLAEVVERGRTGTNTRGADVAMQNLVDALSHIWVKHWGTWPGVSQGAKNVGGPFFRFIGEYLKIVKEQLTGDDIAMDPQLINALRPSEQALRKRIHKSPYQASHRTPK